MKETDGIILKTIENYSASKLSKISLFISILWIVTPLMMMVMKCFSLPSYTVHGILIMVLYFSGCIGWIIGCAYIFKCVKNLALNKREIIDYLEPLILLLVFGLWILICTLSAKEVRIAVYGYEQFRDNFLTFFFYGGLLFAGITVAHNIRNVKIVSIVFLLVSIFTSLASLIGGDIGNLLLRKDVCNVSNLLSPFGSYHYFGSYLLMGVIVSYGMFAFSKTVCVKLLTSVACVFLMSTLVKNGDFLNVIVVFVSILMLTVYGLHSGDKALFKKMLTLDVMLVLVLVLLLLFSDKTLQIWLDTFNVGFFRNKVDKIEEVWKLVYDNPIVGVGPQNTMQNSDNLLVQIAVYLGFPGLLIYISQFLLIVKNCKVTSERSASNIVNITLLLSLVASLTFGGSIYYISAYLYYVIGMYYSCDYRVEE